MKLRWSFTNVAGTGLRQSLAVAVATTVALLIGALYATELVLRFSGSGSASTKAYWNRLGAAPESEEFLNRARASGARIDPRDRLEVVSDMRQQRGDAVTTVLLGDVLGENGRERPVVEPPALGGISNALTVMCNEEGPYVWYDSDEHGFRNPKGIWGAHRADLAALGQSIPQGFCVPDGEGFVDLMRVDNPVTLNLATSGQNALVALAAIKEYLPDYAPRRVLWFYSENMDLIDLYKGSTHRWLMRYLEPGFRQDLIKRQAEIDNGLRRLEVDVEQRGRTAGRVARAGTRFEGIEPVLKLWDLRQRLYADYGIRTLGEDPPGSSVLARTRDELLREILARARDTVAGWGGTLYFVYLPSWDRYHNGPIVPDRERKPVVGIANALDIPVIDVAVAFAASPDPLSLFPFRRFGHYNEAGNRIVAEAVRKAISIHESRVEPLSSKPANGGPASVHASFR
jgi:hypothetical protein